MKKLAILGAGGHAKVVADIALLSGWDEVAYFDDKFDGVKTFYRGQTLGTINDLKNYLNLFNGFIVAIGDNSKRLNFINEFKPLLKLVTLIHPSALISPSVTIADGVVVMAHVSINAATKIEQGCILNTNCSVDHDCHIAEAVHICPGSTLAGNIIVGKCSWVGIGSSIIEGLKIGESVIIGAGATVIKDIEDNLKVVGTPARPLC